MTDSNSNSDSNDNNNNNAASTFSDSSSNGTIGGITTIDLGLGGNAPKKDWHFAIKNFEATTLETLTVLANEPLHVLDDSDNDWWYCISPRTELAGYVPALFIETTNAHIARLNTMKNMNICESTKAEQATKPPPSQVQKKVKFNEKVTYDDGETGQTAKKRKKLTKREKTISIQEIFADQGVIRIYAGIWDLNVSYKAIRVDEKENTLQVLSKAVERFTHMNQPVSTIGYELYICIGDEERKLMPNESPLAEINNLDSDTKALVKFLLKKNKRPIESKNIMLRVYTDMNNFKTILIVETTTVAEAIELTMKKFKVEGEPKEFTMKYVVDDGDEHYLQRHDLMVDVLHELHFGMEGHLEAQFFLVRTLDEDEENDEGDKFALNVYGGNLDMDISYRTVHVTDKTTSNMVIQLALERYNSVLPSSDFVLCISIASKDKLELKPDECPLPVLKQLEKENEGFSVKVQLRRKKTAANKAMETVAEEEEVVDEAEQIPFNVYCDFKIRNGNAAYKAVMVDELSTTTEVLSTALALFSVTAPMEMFSLSLVSDTTGARKLLKPDDRLLQIRNEMEAKDDSVQCHLHRNIDAKDMFPIRVFGNKIWPEEGYKTIIGNPTMNAVEAIITALPKFRFPSVTASDFCLARVVDDQEILLADDEPITSGDIRHENYILLKREIKILSDKQRVGLLKNAKTKLEPEKIAAATGLDISEVVETETLPSTENFSTETMDIPKKEDIQHLIKMYA